MIARIVLMGVVATLATDLWQRLLQATAGLPPANWGLIGRWVAGFPRGVFVHRPISATASVRGEIILGWVFHYAVGHRLCRPLSGDHEVGLWLGTNLRLRHDLWYRASR